MLMISELHRDIENIERYSQENATKMLLKALHDSEDPQWLEIFKQALAKERRSNRSNALCIFLH